MRKVLLYLFLAILFFCDIAFSANIHIDPSLADPNTGEDGSFANPYNSWTDISFSVSDDYYQKCDTSETITSTITISTSGTSGDNITIGAYYGVGSPTYGVSGAKPIIDRPNKTGSVIRIVANYVTVENLELRRAESSLRIDGDYNTIRDVKTGGGANYRGLWIYSGSYNVIDSCIVDSDYEESWGGDDGGNGLAIGIESGGVLNAAYNEIKNCTVDSWKHAVLRLDVCYANNIHDNEFTNDSNLGGSGYQLGFSADNNLIYNNIFANQGDYAQIGGGDNNKIYANIFDGGCLSGTGDCDLVSTSPLVSFQSHTGTDTNNEFYNNVIYSPVRGVQFYSSGSANSLDGNVVRNNIFYSSGSSNLIFVIVDNSDPNFGTQTFENNQIYWTGGTGLVRNHGGAGITVAAWNSATDDTTADNAEGDPLFDDAANDDFTLGGSSPCLNNGHAVTDEGIDQGWTEASSYPPNTVSTISRTDYGGTAPDIGVYEQTASDTDPPVRGSPDPAQDQVLPPGTATYDMETDCTDASDCTGCKADQDGSESYAAMQYTMVQQGANGACGTNCNVWRHSLTGLTNDTSYTWYFRCTDGTNINTDDYELGFSVSPAFSGEVIVDNLDSGFSEEVGTWDQSTATTGYYSANYTTNRRDYLDVARFTPSIPYAGSYDVYLYWSSNASRHTAAPITIVHASGSATETVDQTANGDQWNYIGSWNFNAGTSGYVELGPEDSYSGMYICADAVRFVYVSESTGSGQSPGAGMVGGGFAP